MIRAALYAAVFLFPLVSLGAAKKDVAPSVVIQVPTASAPAVVADLPSTSASATDDLDASVQEQIDAMEAAPASAIHENVPVLNDKKESEIPVLTNTDKKKHTDSDGLAWRLILSAVVLLGVVGGAFIFIRRWRQSHREKAKHTQIKVLTQHYLGPKKSLAIIRVAGESILIGVTEHNISLIKELSLLDEEIPDETPHNFRGEIEQHEEDDLESAGGDEEYSYRGIQDLVTRTKKSRGIFS